MHKVAKVFAIGFFGFAACSTEGRVTPLTSGGGSVPTASVWSVAVRGCERSADCEDIRAVVVGRLVGTSLAERIVAAGQPAQLALSIDVSNVRIVSGVARIFGSVLAGRNEVSATATLQDLRGPAPATVRSYKVESGSASHVYSSENGLQDAYRRFASDVVAGLRS